MRSQFVKAQMRTWETSLLILKERYPRQPVTCYGLNHACRSGCQKEDRRWTWECADYWKAFRATAQPDTQSTGKTILKASPVSSKLYTIWWNDRYICRIGQSGSQSETGCDLFHRQNARTQTRRAEGLGCSDPLPVMAFGADTLIRLRTLVDIASARNGFTSSDG